MPDHPVPRNMTIVGWSRFLIAVGAVLKWAVTAQAAAGTSAPPLRADG